MDLFVASPTEVGENLPPRRDALISLLALKTDLEEQRDRQLIYFNDTKKDYEERKKNELEAIQIGIDEIIAKLKLVQEKIDFARVNDIVEGVDTIEDVSPNIKLKP